MKKIKPAGHRKQKPTTLWWKKNPAPPEIITAYSGQPTGFENDRVDDYEWPNASPEQQRDPVFPVVWKADETGDIEPVFEYIRQYPLTTPAGRELVADFLYRRTVHKRTPIYAQSLPDRILHSAIRRVQELVKSGNSESTAIEAVAKEEGMPKTILETAILGKRGSMQRMKKGHRGAASPKKRPKGVGAD